MLLRYAIALWLAVPAVSAKVGRAADGNPELDRVSPPLHLAPVAKLPPGPGREISGIVRSRAWPDAYWTINDSGDEPRLYAIRRDGTLHAEIERNNDAAPGVTVGGAINVDWEDIAVDDHGHVIVADVGNNQNDRRDLVLYFVQEPAPTAERTAYFRRIFVRYPEQTEFPAAKENFNFDCEAVFALGSQVFLLTTHRSNTATRAYRRPLDVALADKPVELEFIEEFAVGGQVTAADASADGRFVAVATYDQVWLFDVVDVDRPLSGRARRIAFAGPKEVESTSFTDEHTLMLADEATCQLYEIPLTAFGEPTPTQIGATCGSPPSR